MMSTNYFITAIVIIVMACESAKGAPGKTERNSLIFQRVEDHRQDGGRSGEGAAVQLEDGRLLLLYSRFSDGAADHSPADVVKRISKDAGKSWSEPEIVFSRPAGALNVMSVSLLRLQDGRIGCVFLIKLTQLECAPHWTASSDGGQTWDPLIPMARESAYIIGNNDRLIQLQDGTLVYPYALHDKTLDRFDPNASCGLLYSADQGRSWRRAADANRYREEWHVPPEAFRRDRVSAGVIRRVESRANVFQEPGVVELEDGRLMMWVRSHTHVYLSYLDRLEGKWEAFRPAPGLNVCLGPQTIKRLPGSRRLVMFYNDRGDVGYGEPGYTYRTPLSVALSDDDGKTWKRHSPIEPSDAKSYCYFSLLFFGDKFLLSYYESADRTDLLDAEGKVALEFDGRPRRRNLASLKICLGPISFFQD